MTETFTKPAAELIKDTKPRNTFPDRLTVIPSNLEKIGRLVNQLTSSCPGVEVSRKDILNWIVEKIPEELSAADIKDLSGRFYDEERFLKFALEEVRAAKARGEKRTLEDILQNMPQAGTAVTRRPRKPKIEALIKSEQDLSELSPKGSVKAVSGGSGNAPAQ
ncbi:hypothetical protein WDW37_20820 [Bdellovibrionota bacterium FG-1]